MIRHGLVAVMLLAGALAQAPGNLPEEGRPNRPAHPKTDYRVDSRELLEQVMIARLSKELALNDEQTILLVRRVSEFRDLAAQARKQRGQLLKDLKKALDENLSEEQLQQKLDAIIAHDTEAAESRQVLFRQLGEDLTAWQQGRLYLFMTDFESDMRRLMQRAKERRYDMRGMGGDWRGGGGPGEGPGRFMKEEGREMPRRGGRGRAVEDPDAPEGPLQDEPALDEKEQP